MNLLASLQLLKAMSFLLARRFHTNYSMFPTQIGSDRVKFDVTWLIAEPIATRFYLVRSQARIRYIIMPRMQELTGST